jgi:hypothetical protein
MTRVSEDEYRRDTSVLGANHTYRFRRIVDGKGNRLPAYDELQKVLVKLGLKKALLPYCAGNTNDTLPTSCRR